MHKHRANIQAQQTNEQVRSVAEKLDAEAMKTNKKLDAVQEELRAVTQEATRVMTRQYEQLRENLAQQLVAVKVESEERAEAGEAKLEELRVEVAGLRRSLEKQSDPQLALAQVVSVVGRPECSDYTGQGHYYGWSEPGDTGLCAGERGQPGERVWP